MKLELRLRKLREWMVGCARLPSGPVVKAHGKREVRHLLLVCRERVELGVVVEHFLVAVDHRSERRSERRTDFGLQQCSTTYLRNRALRLRAHVVDESDESRVRTVVFSILVHWETGWR